MKPISLLSLSLLAAAASYAAPADACSPPQPGLTSTVPVDGASYPANGFILFGGYEISLDAVTVTVDGAAASLIEAEPQTDFARFAARVARVSPEPSPGQEIVVSGTYCSDEFGECEATTFSYTATAPDADPPAPNEVAVSYDVYDHKVTDPAVGACDTNSTMHYYLHVDSDLAETEGAPLFWKISGRHGQEEVLSRVVGANGPTLDLTVALDIDVESAADLCVDATLLDAAGNAQSEVISSCAACMFRSDDDGTVTQEFIQEPTWTDADAYPGGLCATSVPPINPPPPGDIVDDEDGDTVVNASCGCSVPGEPPSESGWALALLGAAALISRRRA